MNPKLLQTFLAVCRHLNYTHAGEEVFLSQPAVSRQIRQLESELGVRLFEQIGKSLHLTAAGQTLSSEAEKLMGAMKRTKEAVQAHRTAEHGCLRIGASTTPGFYLLPPVLGRFHERFPKVDLDYAVENSQHVGQMIIRNALDLGLVGAHLPNEEGLKLEPLVEDEIVCFASSSHPLAKSRSISPRSLEKETCVIREKGSATRQLFETWLTSQGGKLGKTIELHSLEAMTALVAAGVGFSFMSVHGLLAGMHSKQLKKLPVSRMSLVRPIYLVRHAEKHISPVMEAFLKILRTTL